MTASTPHPDQPPAQTPTAEEVARDIIYRRAEFPIPVGPEVVGFDRETIVSEIAAALTAERARADEAVARAERLENLPAVQFYQRDWMPGFAAFVANATTPAPDARAFCVLNLGGFLAAVEAGHVPRSDLPYMIADSMMHEVMHALEQWAGVEFSEERIEALLERYRADARKIAPRQPEAAGAGTGGERDA